MLCIITHLLEGKKWHFINYGKWKVCKHFQLAASPGEFKYENTSQISKGGIK